MLKSRYLAETQIFVGVSLCLPPILHVLVPVLVEGLPMILPVVCIISLGKVRGQDHQDHDSGSHDVS